MKHVQVRCDTYNIGFDAIFQVYLHAGGGKWIKSGLENFAQRKMVMDGYHFRETGSKFRRSKWNADSDSQSCTASRSEAQLKNWNRCQTKTPQQLDTVHLILDY